MSSGPNRAERRRMLRAAKKMFKAEQHKSGRIVPLPPIVNPAPVVKKPLGTQLQRRPSGLWIPKPKS